MLFIYDRKNDQFSVSEETYFKSHAILERKHIEKWVADFPQLLGEELLILTTEYDRFDKTKERLDVLCLDKNGKVVIVELKRDESGKDVELQAIKYAAYCSHLIVSEIVSIRKDFLIKNHINKTDEEVKKEIYDFIDNIEFEELDEKPRIIITARDFSPEVIASVLWLRTFGLDITCVKLTPHAISNEQIGLVSSILIPLPEAKDYIVKAERKESTKQAHTRSQQEYINFYKEIAGLFGQKIPMPLNEPDGNSYYKIPTQDSGVHFEWGFHGRPRSSFGVELHFEKGNKESNRVLLESLTKYKADIEKQTGEKVVFQQNWGQSWARLYIEKQDGKMTDELKKWAVDKMIIVYKLLNPKL